MGMDLSKAAYIYQDFASEDEVKNFDFSIFDSEFEIKPGDMTDKLAGIALLKFYARQFLDNRVIKSCIAGGFDGISFYGSDLLDSENDIDIIVSYKIKLPVKLFIIDEMLLMQRVRMRKWTGLGLQAPNSIHNDDDESIVYVTETGTVYHTKKTCSHISLSVRAVSGIPVDLRNESGARYYPCELCCKEPTDDGVYYITSDGTRYHAVRNCSRIKRTVKEIKLSEVGNRTLCKRCAKS